MKIDPRAASAGHLLSLEKTSCSSPPGTGFRSLCSPPAPPLQLLIHTAVKCTGAVNAVLLDFGVKEQPYHGH